MLHIRDVVICIKVQPGLSVRPGRSAAYCKNVVQPLPHGAAIADGLYSKLGGGEVAAVQAKGKANMLSSRPASGEG